MRDFYERFYRAAAHSRSHARFCERVFGRDLCQHGFADMAQLDALIAATQLKPGQRGLDLGCGNGMIAEYIADRTGAQLTGLDFIPGAIRDAQARTAAKADRLDFIVGDINALALPPAAFDAIISIDTIYFSNDYSATIGELGRALRPGGAMAFLYSHGREPWVPVAEFDAGTLPADQTPLALALRANGRTFETQDFTADDHRLALLRKQVLAELKPQFAAEDVMFIYDNRLGDANGISQACEMGLQRRYLYVTD
jgi:cyclopropane fatty-acyl-phospholipid synthase-like methyltransferase